MEAFRNCQQRQRTPWIQGDEIQTCLEKMFISILEFLSAIYSRKQDIQIIKLQINYKMLIQWSFPVSIFNLSLAYLISKSGVYKRLFLEVNVCLVGWNDRSSQASLQRRKLYIIFFFLVHQLSLVQCIIHCLWKGQKDDAQDIYWKAWHLQIAKWNLDMLFCLFFFWTFENSKRKYLTQIYDFRKKKVCWKHEEAF